MVMNEKNIRCLISAGPTREYFDPIRYLSNCSSGKMGYALAEAAFARGWQVDLVSGPVFLQKPDGVALHRVVTGDEMFGQINRLFDHCDILIMAAAVMDYIPENYSKGKLKKSSDGQCITLKPAVDILKTVSARKKDQMIVGFAAESENVIQYARDKLKKKNCDYIVANPIGKKGIGFEADKNEISLISASLEVFHYGPQKKSIIAELLIEHFSSDLKKRV
jgi:phosphopantothenoylcysteine synthetase/decarboxylase